MLLTLIVLGMWPKPTPVEVAKVARGALTVSVFEEGRTRIRHRYTVSAPVAGQLNRVPLRAGAPITEGETVLATLLPEPAGFLDPRTRAQAEAALLAAESTVELRQAEWERAQAMFALAEKEFTRAEALQKNRAIATQERDAAESLLQVRSREMRAAEFALRVAGFEVEQAEAALLQTDLAESGETVPLVIVAPVSGYVLQVHEESARVLASGAPIMEVGDPQDLEAEIELLSSDAGAVEPGAEVSIEQWGGEKPLLGRVNLVERGGFTKFSALGVEEQRVLVRVDFTDPFPEWQNLGDRYRVEARIVTWHEDDVLQVPTGALFRRGNAWMTFIMRDGKASRQQVEVGRMNSNSAQVLSGLEEGDQVIMYPPDTIEEGTSVSPEKSADD